MLCGSLRAIELPLLMITRLPIFPFPGMCTALPMCPAATLWTCSQLLLPCFPLLCCSGDNDCFSCAAASFLCHRSGIALIGSSTPPQRSPLETPRSRSLCSLRGGEESFSPPAAAHVLAQL